MKKLNTLLLALLITSTISAQFRYAENEHTSLGLFLDGGTLDTKDVIGKKAFNGGIDFMYVNSGVSIHFSSEWFPELDNYKDFMFAFGSTFQVGHNAKWELFAAPRFGAVIRNSDIDELPRTRWNLGFESQVTYWITRDFGIFTHANYTQRNDQEVRGYDVTMVLSARVGVRINLSSGKR